jgi:hypothetical protein
MPGGLCYFHANPDKASELGQRGGKAKSSEGASDAAGYVDRPLENCGGCHQAARGHYQRSALRVGRSSNCEHFVRARRFVRPAHLQSESWLAGRSDRYVKALKASFPPDRWPAEKVVEADGSIRFLLKDGTEIHRIGPPPEILEY